MPPETLNENNDLEGRVEDVPNSTSVEFDERAIEETREAPPEGWMTNYALASLVGKEHHSVARLANQYRANHQEWFDIFLHAQKGKDYEFYSPELVQEICNDLNDREPPPEGWTTNSALANLVGKNRNTILRLADQYRADHQEWFGKFFSHKPGGWQEYYSPELVSNIRDDLDSREPPPEGWTTNSALARQLGKDFSIITNLAIQYRTNHQEWFKDIKVGKGSIKYTYYSPELVDKIRDDLNNRELPPEGWVTNSGLARQARSSQLTIANFANKYRANHQEWFGTFRHASLGKEYEFYSPELVEKILEELGGVNLPPEGWVTNNSLASQVGKSFPTIANLVNKYRANHQKWFGTFFHPQLRREFEYYSPELVLAIERELEHNKTSPSQELEQLLLDPESPDLETLKRTIGLFGGASATDVLFNYFPQFKDLPPDVVKGKLAEYLGEFLVFKGKFSLPEIGDAEKLLADPNLKERLADVVRQDCFDYYVAQKRANRHLPDDQIFNQYFNAKKQEAASLGNDQINDILNQVQDYYRSLVEDLAIPSQIVPSLRSERDFPDLNQRINIKEILDKKKILLADEMGVGKSASAILAKEISGAKCALVVCPANVIDTWKGYLSSPQNADETAFGYFTKGNEPRVCVIENLDFLSSIDSSQYDYILISHQRLNERYMGVLPDIDFDMLIVDEVHKLKNITGGKRANNLLQLADKNINNYTVLLSGTPVPNKVEDIAILLKLLYPDKFADIDDKKLIRQIIRGGEIVNLRELLVPRMQKKELSETVEMPRLDEQTTKFELSPYEKKIYEILIEEDELTWQEKVILVRQFLLNPKTIDPTPEIKGAKVTTAKHSLQEAFVQVDKVVMFVNDYIENIIRGENSIVDLLNIPPDISVKIIDGEVSMEERQKIQNEFRESHGKTLLIISGQTADVGVDFSAGERVLFYNEPWTLYNKHQQLGRVYRPGLKNDLTSETFIASGTFEEGLNTYIELKHQAIEKLLNGVPISELEKQLIETEENGPDVNLELNPEKALSFFSSNYLMSRFYRYNKEIGEEKFKLFLQDYGQAYADCYTEMGSRKYQANVSRVAGSLLNRFIEESGQSADGTKIIDIASGPQMLKRHSLETIQDRIISLDINPSHFSGNEQGAVVGSFKRLPYQDSSVDYGNFSLAWHYSEKFAPSRGEFERLEILQEMNRVLKSGGRVLIEQIYSIGLKDNNKFNQLVNLMGFQVDPKFSGIATNERHFQSEIIVLEKVANVQTSLRELYASHKELFDGAKFVFKKTHLKNTRRTIRYFDLNGENYQINLNKQDSAIAVEEDQIISEADSLIKEYGSIKDIPKEILLDRKFSRIFIRDHYVLFKDSQGGSPVVI